ncbi:hypothetical protein D1823_18960 (plasmid) [Ruegeria sp. AD91A]|nr:hypothetical protein D1823_18960 [Ruegeria sp. AD91A]
MQTRFWSRKRPGSAFHETGRFNSQTEKIATYFVSKAMSGKPGTATSLTRRFETSQPILQEHVTIANALVKSRQKRIALTP